MTNVACVQAKTKELKNSLNQEFRLIHELCLFVLNASQKPELIRATLSTLHAFLSWVPLAYIFNSNLVEVLLKLFPQQPFRNVALQCLTEVRFFFCKVPKVSAKTLVKNRIYRNVAMHEEVHG